MITGAIIGLMSAFIVGILGALFDTKPATTALVGAASSGGLYAICTAVGLP